MCRAISTCNPFWSEMCRIAENFTTKWLWHSGSRGEIALPKVFYRVYELGFYRIIPTIAINAIVNTGTARMIAQAAGRAKFIVHPMPNRSGTMMLASFGLK